MTNSVHGFDPEYPLTLVMGNTNRSKILDVLVAAGDEPMRQAEIGDIVGVDQATVSRNLQTLRDNGIVETTGAGQRIDPDSSMRSPLRILRGECSGIVDAMEEVEVAPS